DGKPMEEALRAYRLKAQLLTTLFRFGEAEAAYQAALAAAPDSFKTAFELARFHQGLNRSAQAVATYERALELARRSGDPVDLADTLNNLGILYAAQDRADEGRRAYAESLAIRRRLAQQKPELAADVAMTLNNLGVLESRQNRIEEARQAF